MNVQPSRHAAPHVGVPEGSRDARRGHLGIVQATQVVFWNDRSEIAHGDRDGGAGSWRRHGSVRAGWRAAHQPAMIKKDQQLAVTNHAGRGLRTTPATRWLQFLYRAGRRPFQELGRGLDRDGCPHADIKQRSGERPLRPGSLRFESQGPLRPEAGAPRLLPCYTKLRSKSPSIARAPFSLSVRVPVPVKCGWVITGSLWPTGVHRSPVHSNQLFLS